MIFRPLIVVAKVVPIVAWVVWFGTGLISFVLAVTVSVITIAVAWVRFMPMFSLTILAIWAAIVGWIIYWRKQSKIAIAVETKAVPSWSVENEANQNKPK